MSFARNSLSVIFRRLTPARLTLGLAAIALIASCLARYWFAPSFWLDEAFVAVSLRDPSPQSIFSPLTYGQFFPRTYLSAIAVLRELFGYQIWVLRLLPSFSFIIATILWARLLAKRSGSFVAVAVLSAALLVGASFWLDQEIQLKQYTLDVLVALIPFLIGDEFFKDSLVDGKHKTKLTFLAVPCLVSYSYPIALVARVIGWYIYQGRRRGWRLNASAASALVVATGIGLAGIWLTDHRYNLQSHEAYLAYWNHCLLRSRFEQGIGSALKLIAQFIWGWHHGRMMPGVVAAVAPLQALGVYRVMARWKNRETDSDSDWGSRTFGSLSLLIGVILASALFSYPICTGRLVLFTQVHTQILTIEGALFILSCCSKRKTAIVFLYIAIGIVVVYSGHRYIDHLRSEPRENIRPMLSLIKPEIANTLVVHPCSVAQVESLPDPLPIEHVVFERKGQPPPTGVRAWILWTNLSDDYCREWLNEARTQALSWHVIHEGPGRGLVLAEF
jgi:hypothetical protein